MLCRGPLVRTVAGVVLVCHAAACAPNRVNAPLGLAPGDRVRVTMADNDTVTGRAVGLGHDTLVVESDGNVTPVAAMTVRHLEVRTETHGHAPAVGGP